MPGQVLYCSESPLISLENMTKDTIERAIASGEPRSSGAGVYSVNYEAMLPGGLAVVM